MTEAELVARLREWARLSSFPLCAPAARPPTGEEAAVRLREATAMWVACARLGELGAAARAHR